MTFPHYFHFFRLPIHPHPTMEVVAYAAGFQLYRRTRDRWPRAALPAEANVWLIVAAAAAALVGSKLLAWVEAGPEFWKLLRDPRLLANGKTIVGGLLGGWAGVEIAKRLLNVRHSTGDVFVLPLVVGMAIGRVGCFLTGLSDGTCGLPTTLPWGIDFGDGPRHPAQLYDIFFLLLLGVTLTLYSSLVRPEPLPNGWIFRCFMLAYLAYRFAVEFLKPRYHPYLGLSAIQIACLTGVIVVLTSLHRSSAGGNNSVPNHPLV